MLVARAFGIKIFSLSWKDFGQVSLLGVIQTTVHYAIFYIGVSNTSGTKGSIMNATTAFFGVVLAHFIYRNDKLSPRKAIGSILGFIGVVIVNFNADILNFSFNVRGEGFVIIAAFIFSAMGIYAKKLTKTQDVVLITSYGLLIGGVLLTLLGMALGGKADHFTWESSSLLLYLALSSSGSFYLWNWLLKYNKVGRVSVYNFLVPVFGTALSSIFLGEQVLELKNLLALVLVSFGIWMVNKEDTALTRLSQRSMSR
ncbi:DMT family transporter [Paenibacillus aestuarii]|uniref:DMT family transporter n=1 Tax=Paenibacillus aestuarii TaxID=516965 RepID=A0ABW0K155_9BACL|nr:DMT family transporter [Paenibacillus aestuarii]